MEKVRAESVVGELERLCAGDLDHLSLQTRSAEVIRSAVPFDVAVQTSVDPATMLDTSCLPLGMEQDPDREQLVFQLEYRQDTPLSYREIARRPARAAALRLEVDDPHEVPRYTAIMEPNGGFDELRATFVADGLCWGSFTLYRMRGGRVFDPEEVAFFTGISEVMGRGLRQAFLRAATALPESLDDPPGHLVMSRSGKIISTTEAAERWLDTLEPSDRSPAVLASLVAAVDHSPAARVTVTGSAGPLTIHASQAKGIDEAVAMIIERPRAVDLTPAIVAAYGLTDRERQVTEAVLHGLVTKQIARRLGISGYTVQDHLKAVFEKVGVVTRGELTYEVFIRHYLLPTVAGSTPGPYGYYLDPPVGDGPVATAAGDA